jgi:hypothetical protein
MIYRKRPAAKLRAFSCSSGTRYPLWTESVKVSFLRTRYPLWTEPVKVSFLRTRYPPWTETVKVSFWYTRYLISCCQLQHRPNPRPKRNAEEVEYEDQDDPGDQEADGVRKHEGNESPDPGFFIVLLHE